MAKKTKDIKRPVNIKHLDIPSNHHLAKQCNPQRVIRNIETEAIEGIWSNVFELRPEKNESYISTYCMEAFGQNIDIQYKESVKSLRTIRKFTLKPKGAIARLNVGLIKIVGKERNHNLKVKDKSSKINPGYAGIYGMPKNNSDTLLLDLLAQKCCVEFRSIEEIDALP